MANETVQPRQTPDGLLEVRRAGRKTPDYAIVEFQTYPDKRVPRQMLDDMMLTFQTRQTMPDLYLFVLKPKGNLRVDSSFEMTSPGGSATFRATWAVIEAWTLSADDLLAKEDPGLVPWAMLGQTSLPPEPFLTECRRIVEEKARPDDVDALVAVSEVFGTLGYNRQLLRAIFARGRDMIESPVLDEWFAIKEQRVMQKNILEVLDARFGTVPTDIQQRVRGVSDADELRRINRTAATCADFDAFRQALPSA